MLNKEKSVYETEVEIGPETNLVLSRLLIDARGPWIDGGFIVPVAGAHITLKKFTDFSLILEAEDGRLFFVINQNDKARVGTTERIDPDPDKVQATDEDINYLLLNLKKYFPGTNFGKNHILSADAGIRPLAKPGRELAPHHISREHEFVTDASGVIHVLGVKLTDHRRAAEILMKKILPQIRTWRPRVKDGSVTQAPL